MKKRGIALISVLIVAAAVMSILAAGLKLGSSGVLFVSKTYQRDAALCAAEAGVYEAMRALETNRNFSGAQEGTLAESGAEYSFTVTNDLWSGQSAQVISEGRYGTVTRTLRVTLEPDTESFGALSLGGRVYAYDRAYINGIGSPSNPVHRPGHLHSEYAGGNSLVGGDFDGDGQTSLMRATGDVSVAGTIDETGLELISRSDHEGVTEPQFRLDKSILLDRTFTASGDSSAGIYSGNHRFTGDVTFPTKVTIEDGATIHVQGGNAHFLGGLEGNGTLIVDGDIVIQTTGEFKPENQEGVTVFADGSVSIAHPEADGGDDGLQYEIDAVGDYFAQMPPEAFTEIATGIPVTAPRDGEFFLWYDSVVDGGGDSSFQLWFEGDGTEINPGLSPATKEWLNNSRPIKEDIKAWADSATED